MNTIVLKKVGMDEIDWVNEKYREVNFISSDYTNELVVIAHVNNEKAGLGRLVKIDEDNIELGGIYVFPNFRGMGVAHRIVDHLCKGNPFENAIIWCLPFDNLKAFYSNFGFEIYNGNKVPEKIADRLKWCNTDNRYGKEVILLRNLIYD